MGTNKSHQKKPGRQFLLQRNWDQPDLLSPLEGGSAAMGRFNVETDPGKKDTGLIKFETRGTTKKFDTIQPMKVPENGKTVEKPIREQPADKWVAYAREMFMDAAQTRSRIDIPDDLSTPKENEASSTGLKTGDNRGQ